MVGQLAQGCYTEFALQSEVIYYQLLSPVVIYCHLLSSIAR